MGEGNQLRNLNTPTKTLTPQQLRQRRLDKMLSSQSVTPVKRHVEQKKKEKPRKRQPDSIITKQRAKKNPAQKKKKPDLNSANFFNTTYRICKRMHNRHTKKGKSHL